MSLFQGNTLAGKSRTPFYAGIGNRLTDALSYRSVSIPPTRIFTINSNAEVSMHLLALNQYRTSYVSMRELVDHYFPPVGMLVKEGGEEYTDFNYWRDKPLEVDDFSASESESDGEADGFNHRPSIDESIRSEDEGAEEDLEASYYSRESVDGMRQMEDSIMESIEGDLESSMFLEDHHLDDEADDEAEGDLEEELEQSEALDLAATPHVRASDPQDDLKDLAKVLNSPEGVKDQKRDEII